MVRQRLWLLPSTAQHSTEAGMAQLPCICSWVPQAGSPCCQTVLPAGLTPPRNGIDCLWQAAVLGRPAVSSICSSSIYVALAVCQAPCTPPLPITPWMLHTPLPSCPHSGQQPFLLLEEASSAPLGLATPDFL